MGFETNNIDQGVLLLLQKKIKELQDEVDALAHGGGGGGSVDSVNGKTGVVVLDKTDIGLSNVDNVRQYSASNPPPYPVTSVNSQTGAVTITVPTKVSDLTNDSGFVNAAGAAAAAPVQSVNGQTGAVTVSGGSGIAVQDATPTNGELVWVDTDDSGAFRTIPEVDDDSVSSSDTWSSQKINTMFSSGTSNGWTYYRIGTICFAWYYKQLTGVNITASWSGLYYRSGEIEAAPYPTFLANGYKFSAALAGGSQNGGVTLGRIMDTNSALRVYLMATGSVTSANCAVMVFAMGTWND